MAHDPIPLSKLEARLMRFAITPAPPHIGRKLADGTTQWGGWPSPSFSYVDSVAEADCLWLLCPACFIANGGSVGTHAIRIDFAGRGVPDEHCIKNKEGKPVRWTVVSGTTVDDLRLSPSIQLHSRCNWHGFVGRLIPGYADEA